MAEISVSALASERRQEIVGAAMVFAAAVAFSAKAVMVKLAYAYPVDPVTLLALRMLFSLPFFLGVALWHRNSSTAERLSIPDRGAVIALGLVGYYLASILDFMGLEYVSAGLERLILFLYPTMVVLLSALWLRKPVTRRQTAAIGLSYAGIALAFIHDISLNPDGLLIGSALVFGSALSYAIYLIGSGQLITRVGTIRFTAYAMTVSSLAGILQFAAIHPLSALRLPAPVYGLAFAMAIMSTVLPAFLISAGIRRIGAGNAALVGSVGPVSTIFLASIFLHESLSVWQMGGTALVLMGVTLVGAGKGR